MGSGAWLTNLISGTYVGADGRRCKWQEYYRIIAPPTDAVLDGDTWTMDGSVLGRLFATQTDKFIITEERYTDACGERPQAQGQRSDYRAVEGW